MEPLEINLRNWPDTGSEPGNWADVSYSAGLQPISEWDNFWNYNVGHAINDLEDAVNDIINRMPPGTEPLDDMWLSKTDPTIEGPLDLNGYDMVDGPRTIWNASNRYIQQSALQNDDIQINTGDGLAGGGQVRLGRSIDLSVEDGAFVERAGDSMTGDLEMRDNWLRGVGLLQVQSFRTDSHVNIGGKNLLHSLTTTEDYPLALVSDELETSNYETGIAFGSTPDTRSFTPGASITFDRTGGWSAGNLTFRTKGDESRTGNALRRLTIQSDGDIDFYENQLTRFTIERRSNRPADPAVGRLIYREDRD